MRCGQCRTHVLQTRQTLHLSKRRICSDNRDQLNRLGIEGFDQLGEVRQRTGQPVDLVDNDDVNPTGVDILQELLEGRAVEITAGISGVVIVLGNGLPCEAWLLISASQALQAGSCYGAGHHATVDIVARNDDGSNGGGFP